MSDTAHSVPGQSVLERLYARGAVRPHIGASSAFYDRLGLADPWTEFRGWTPAESDPDGMFFFLSAAPYYARLKNQRQRDWRARRRLLMRLSEPMPTLQERVTRRMTGAVTLGAGATAPQPRVSQLAWTGDSAMVALVSAMVPDATPEEAAQARPERERRPSRRRRDESQAVDLLREVVRVASGPARRVLVRVIEEVSALPVEEQVIVTRHVTRQLKGSAGRLARAAVRDDAENLDSTPVRVAAGRAEPAATRRRGLRPVLAKSPSMQNLAFEEPQAVEPAQPTRRRREPKAPPAPPSAYREVPAAAVARDVRTQRVTGRAGPEEVVALAAAPARPRRRPTEWAATLARESRRTAPTDTRHGLEAVRRPARRGITRIAVRASEVTAEPRRAALIAQSPTRFLRHEIDIPIAIPAEGPAPTARAIARVVSATVRRSRFVAAPPTSYIQHAEVSEPTAGPVERRERPVRPARQTAERPVAEPRVTATSARPTPTRPGRTRPEPQVEATPSRRTSRRVAPPAVLPVAEVAEEAVEAVPVAARRRTSATRHAVDRSEPVVRRDRVVAAPVSRDEVEVESTRELVRPTRPVVRAAERAVEAPDRGRSRVSLATRPTSYVDQVVRPVEAVEAASEEAPRRRHGRPTVRAAARVERSARSDTRGTALLTTGPTDYLAVADAADAQGPIARRPGRRPRPMRGSEIDTDQVIEPIGATPAAPAARRTPTARVAERLDDTRAETRRVRAAPMPVAPSADEEPAERVLVRDARGKVRRSRRVAIGSAAYASARLVSMAAEQAAVVEPRETSRRRLHTPLERRAVSRRRAMPRPMAHTVAGADLGWLVPDAAPVRVVGQRRVTGKGAVSSDRLADVLRRVSSAVRAVDRADDARVLLPMARRGLDEARITAEPRRRAFPTVGEGIVLRIVIDDEPQAPVARAERRGTVRELTRSGAATRPLRREFGAALATLQGVPQRPTEQASTRADERSRPAARRTAARTVRTADGAYRPSPSRLPIAQVDRLVTPERATVAPVATPTRRSRRADAVAGATYARTVEAPEEVVPTTAVPGRARPLGRTLDYVGGVRRQVRRPATPDLTLANREVEADDDAPAWADRAVHGTALKRRRRDVEEAPSAPAFRGGDLFTALARASRPEDVVQVIVERGNRLRSDTGGLPEPAVRLVERIARVQQESTVARMRVAPEGDLVDAGQRSRRSSAASSVRMATLPKASSGGGAAAARKVQTLADKLMKLIHLAEVERKVTEAQRHVRMASDTAEARAEGGHGATAGKAGDAPNIKQLESDVLAAVLRELDLMKIRRQEDIDVWW